LEMYIEIRLRFENPINYRSKVNFDAHLQRSRDST
jgi:hypothetical protein